MLQNEDNMEEILFIIIHGIRTKINIRWDVFIVSIYTFINADNRS